MFWGNTDYEKQDFERALLPEVAILMFLHEKVNKSDVG